VGDHGIVERIRVFGDVQILLDNTRRVGQKRPVSIDPAAKFIAFRDVVGADGDQAAIADFEFTVEFDQPFGLTAVFGAEASAAEDDDQGMLALQFGELPMFSGVVGKFSRGRWRLERCRLASWNPLPVGCALADSGLNG